jgi:hypothetical protein
VLIVFHHIPKAGGTSVVKALSQRMRHKRLAFQHEADDWRKVGLIDGLNSSHYTFRDYAGPELFITWIRNPADMFYSAWRYYGAGSRPHPNYRPLETRDFLREFVGASTLEEYVDRCLEADHPHTFPRGLFDLPWERFGFVGVTERMQESLDALGEMLGLKLEAQHINSTGSDNSHRRDEVEAMLDHEMEVYRRWS